MKVLLTGASGLVGLQVVKRLLARKDTVSVLAPLDTVNRLPDRERLNVVVGDLSDRDALTKAASEAEVVYHLAQLLPSSDRDLRDLVRVNVDGTENLLRVCATKVRRIVFTSTVMVYRPALGRSHGPIRENASLRAHGNDYVRHCGQTKIDAENLIRSYSRKLGLEYVILRPTVVYGPGCRFVEDLLKEVIARPLSTLSRHAPLGPMQWVHVSDMAAAVELAGTQLAAANEAFNVAGSELVTIQDIAATIRQILIPVLRLTQDRFKEGVSHPSRLKFDLTKAQTMIGYTPKLTLREGLEQMLASMEVYRRPSGRSW